VRISDGRRGPGLAARSPAQTSRLTVVYLGGFGRSGSTLVERMLGAARGWANVGELVDLARSVAPADERCGCGHPFSTCPVWTRVGDDAFGGWSADVLARLVAHQRAAARQRHLPGLLRDPRTPSAALSGLREDYTRIYRAVARVTGSHVVVDASKGPALGQALAGAPGLDVRMLNVVRDPRAVAWSWNRRVERPHVTSGEARMWRIPARRSAAQWTTLQLEMAAIERVGGVRVARVVYEDFVTNPLRTLAHATTELGLPLTPADIPVVDGGRVELGPSHGLSGNPARFRSGVVELRRDDGWRTDMPPRDRAVVTALTLPLLKAYGYPVRPGSAPPRTDRHETRTHA
jgi:hypothetical protein